MKKFALLFPILFFALVLTSTVSKAQATDPASKTTEIMTMLKSKLNLTAQQQTDVQKAVSDYATKYQGANKKASSGGIDAKVGQDEQKALNGKVVKEIPNLLNDSQKTQFTAIQDKVTALFAQIK